MIYSEVRNKDGEIIFSNVRECIYFDRLVNEKNSIIKAGIKNIKSKIDCFGDISVWLIVEGDSDLLKSSKLFKKTMRIYGEMSNLFLEYYLHKIRAHSHTLRSIQGKMKQKMDGLASKKDFRGQNYAESVKSISNKVTNNVNKTADVLCYLNKRISEIDVHIEGFDVLYMGDEVETNIRSHDIKKVLQNIIAPSLEELSKIDIGVNFHIKDEYSRENKVPLDYKLMNLAFINFFDNAIKYARPDSKMDIFFEKNGTHFELKIVMMSLRIEHDEIEKVFRDGYVGKYATEESGDGIGMYVIKKSLEMMHMKVNIVPDYSVSDNLNGKQYVKNSFIFESK